MTARILPAGEASIGLAAERLRGGEPVALPTETVYGLGAIAFDEAAVARIFALKERPTFDPLIVHVAPLAPAEARDPVAALAAAGLIDGAALSGRARALVASLAAAFWPGPLTLVLPRGAAIPDLVTAGLGTVAVRVPRHPVAQALIARCGFPLAAPSANRFGRISPTSAEDVLAELGDRIELILDGGRCAIGIESTVIALPAGGAPRLLRPGGVALEAIEQICGPIERGASGDARPASPGMMERHYAPRKALRLLSGPAAVVAANELRSGAAGPIGLLLLSGEPREVAPPIERAIGREVIAVSLSVRGDRAEAAARLFSCLRALDASPAVALFAEPCSDDTGLGHAIADRLRRAAR